jgi:hypothetical protein
MKLHTKWLMTALAVASGLAMVNSAQAQPVTGTPYLSNMLPANLNVPPSALYGNWALPATTFTSTPTGLEVYSGGYGSLYYVIPGADVQYPLNSLDTVATLTLTFNSPSSPAPNWIGVQFLLQDGAGSTPNLGGYGGFGNGGNPANWVWTGNQLAITAPLPAAQIAAIQAGTDAIYSFNLGIDGGPLGAATYDITFNSLVLSPVPEPATLALVGLGAASLLAFRRRK